MNLNELLFKITNTSKFDVDTSSLIIKKLIQADNPLMVARFGSTEIKAILYPGLPKPLRFFSKKRIFTNMSILSGFKPPTDATIYKFSKLMMRDMKELDILASWRSEEFFLRKNYQDAVIIPLRALEPYFSNDPWSSALEHKKVLVIHPFSRSIENQYYSNRENLFSDRRVLPKFKSLITIRAVQSIAGGDLDGFQDWFAALEHMKMQINSADFDVAIIGCGAYGFPLSAHIKRLGKKAIHMGGATQILFGIYGKRWKENITTAGLINSYWVRPLPEESPPDSHKVEGGCYW